MTVYGVDKNTAQVL